MEKLLYRGNKYTQNKEIVSKKSVQLKYRRSIYIQKRQLISKVQNDLIYRGNKYLSKGSTNKPYRPDANKKIFSLARDLINAQFNLANDELSRKLWDEVAAFKIDPKRIINLMYRCCSNQDNQSMLDADLDYFSKE
ncbi:DUF4278 domain-containing protein [Prochlorococcus sp. MIT 1307]|uniref:DUF4278 domain-containing protein n=1 Tax=Prochlorococcus sp. MIT 1307 TaxID=3096219 RepID=UPI002A75095A|nr:DUF4278 domain-containing protein [Prochlorococcus sp. MIT 1307]